MRRLVCCCLALCAGLFSACSYEPDAAVVSTTPSARQVSTLLASIQVEVGGERLSAAHLSRITLSVDGEHWGVFGFDAEPPDEWAFDPDADGLMRASIQEDLTLEGDGPDTVGGWAVFLSRALEPGDHVVRVDELLLRTAKGEEVALSLSEWQPFRVELGDGTAWIGDLTFTLDALP